MKRTLAGLGWALLTCAAARAQAPMGSAFTYQGRLADAGVPAAGSFDFRFTLFDAAAAGGAVGAPVSVPAVAVAQGLFAVPLDFGPAAFAGQARWLQVEVRPAGGGSYTTLAPRQEMTPAPHAGFSSRTDPANLTALSASNLTSGTVPGARLAGTYPQALNFSNAGNAITGVFTGDGAGLTGLVASNLAFGTVPGAVVAGTYPNALTLSNPSNVIVGDGSGLTNLDAQPRLRRTVVVSPLGTPAENGTALVAALAGITTASSSNPWLLRIEPGAYQVAPGALVMKPWVDVEGAGERTTRVFSAGTADNATGTLKTADFAALRYLTVENNGAAAFAKAVYVNGTSPTLSHVTAVASGASGENQGIFVDAGAASNPAPQVADCTIAVLGSGPANSFGFLAIGVVFPRVERTASTVQGGNFATAYWNYQSNLTLTSSRGYASLAGSAAGLTSVDGDSFLTDVEIVVNGATSYGISSVTNSFLSLQRSAVSAQGVGIQSEFSGMVVGRSQVGSFGASGQGLVNFATSGAFTVSIDASDIYGSGRTITSTAQFTVYVGGTKLNGPLPAGGTRNCAASYTGAYTPVSATCG
jgi:hypothetical protein